MYFTSTAYIVNLYKLIDLQRWEFSMFWRQLNLIFPIATEADTDIISVMTASLFFWWCAWISRSTLTLIELFSFSSCTGIQFTGNVRIKNLTNSIRLRQIFFSLDTMDFWVELKMPLTLNFPNFYEDSSCQYSMLLDVRNSSFALYHVCAIKKRMIHRSEVLDRSRDFQWVSFV